MFNKRHVYVVVGFNRPVDGVDAVFANLDKARAYALKELRHTKNFSDLSESEKRAMADDYIETHELIV